MAVIKSGCNNRLPTSLVVVPGGCTRCPLISTQDRQHIMTNATITRPEWSTEIDPVLQKELERYVLVTTWDKLLGMVDTIYNWGRRSAVWPLGFGLACCAIEMICTASSRFDIARFGAEVFRGSPRQADLMIVSGTVTKTMMPMIARLVRPDARAQVCALDGCVRHRRRTVQGGLQRRLGCRQIHSGRCLRSRLPADTAGPA